MKICRESPSSSSLGVTTSYLLNDISPFTTVLDADCPILYLHFTDVLFNIVISSALDLPCNLVVIGLHLFIFLTTYYLTSFACVQTSLTFGLLFD